MKIQQFDAVAHKIPHIFHSMLLHFHRSVEEDDSLYQKMEYWKTVGLKIKHSNRNGGW